MKLSTATMEAALRQHGEKYGGDQDGGIRYHVRCWTQAHEAFEAGSPEAFEWLYEQLRSRWQVFRSRNWRPSTARRVKRILDGLPAEVRRLRLGELAQPTPAVLSKVWGAITGAAAIKKNSNGPSLVATTKFLHFWNPRLFVIADRAIIWNWAFAHGWLWGQVQRVRDSLGMAVPEPVRKDRLFKSELGDYLAVLVWGACVLRANPGIMQSFAKHVAAHCDSVPAYVREYEGAALEWLLLGLVELPPAGVTIP